ncbi:MAG: hypothetical protein HKN47_07505, partial [Pirellulaceae bacterium]|nr:hypothetical protein [Pirellulaceae bacterium]
MKRPPSYRKPLSLDTETIDAAPTPPSKVEVIRTLGQGRAARAQLVRATMADGTTIQCVEKVFAPGLLTRTLYRFSFQAPFGYQKNRDAILASFYRRRVAAAVLAASDIQCPTSLPFPPSPPAVAQPLYVRYDTTARAWVLAAQWIQGRGIVPAPADTTRIGRMLQTVTTRGQSASVPQSEIRDLVTLMGEIESTLQKCGLYGSGWQVAPRAMVSTANLLRLDNQYVVIDLESGIPAILVPSYIFRGLRRGTAPPFDDLDADQLTRWIDSSAPLLTFRIGCDAVSQLRRDAEKLIHHSTAWKEAELSLFRRPWNWLHGRRRNAYRAECVRRWKQDNLIDSQTHAQLSTKSWKATTWFKAAVIWLAGLLPSSMGRFASRLMGRYDTRAKFARCIQDSEYRSASYQAYVSRRYARWIDQGRIGPQTSRNVVGSAVHTVLAAITPPKLHRLLVDSRSRIDALTVCVLLLFSRRYQSWFGRRQIESTITRWVDAKRITLQQAAKLQNDLCGEEVGVYTRGFGLHLALKALAPVMLPAKVGGIAAFAGTGNPWFLVPLVFTPVLRTICTIGSTWVNRQQRIAHGEALMVCWIPTLGTGAFLLQMFASR